MPLNDILTSENDGSNSQSTRYVEREFWTSAQRQASSIHEVSYRACFKPQLPRFFIESLTSAREIVYDPFAGRGTTAIEAALLNRNVISNDVNPISTLLTRARLAKVDLNEIQSRLQQIPRSQNLDSELNLDMFFHPQTLQEILSLRRHFLESKRLGIYDSVDCWIEMVATTRLTGHSPGFFSVYTLPPNQAVTADRQVKINSKRNQSPEYRDTHALIVKKSKQLQKTLSSSDSEALRIAGESAILLNEDAAETAAIRSDSVSLTVTSPPFLDVVQYANDNWMRAWFTNTNIAEVERKITMSKTVEEWSEKMRNVFDELYRVTKPGGHVAFEVGEVRNGKVRLEEAVIPEGLNAGFVIKAVLLNTQAFTKTSNIWGIKNNDHGTNTNRIVLFQKP